MPVCFAIGPNGDARAAADDPAHDTGQRSTVFYEEVVRPVCERLGMTLVRAEYESGAGPLSDRSIRHLIDDDLVIADLTRSAPRSSTASVSGTPRDAAPCTSARPAPRPSRWAYSRPSSTRHCRSARPRHGRR